MSFPFQLVVPLFLPEGQGSKVMARVISHLTWLGAVEKPWAGAVSLPQREWAKPRARSSTRPKGRPAGQWWMEGWGGNVCPLIGEIRCVTTRQPRPGPCVCDERRGTTKSAGMRALICSLIIKVSETATKWPDVCVHDVGWWWWWWMGGDGRWSCTCVTFPFLSI